MKSVRNTLATIATGLAALLGTKSADAQFRATPPSTYSGDVLYTVSRNGSGQELGTHVRRHFTLHRTQNERYEGTACVWNNREAFVFPGYNVNPSQDDENKFTGSAYLGRNLLQGKAQKDTIDVSVADHQGNHLLAQLVVKKCTTAPRGPSETAQLRNHVDSLYQNLLVAIRQKDDSGLERIAAQLDSARAEIYANRLNEQEEHSDIIERLERIEEKLDTYRAPQGRSAREVSSAPARSAEHPVKYFIIGASGTNSTTRIIARADPKLTPPGFPDLEAKTVATMGGPMLGFGARSADGRAYFNAEGGVELLSSGHFVTETAKRIPGTNHQYKKTTLPEQNLKGGSVIYAEARGRLPVSGEIGFTGGVRFDRTKTEWPDGSEPKSEQVQVRAGAEADISRMFSVEAGGVMQHMSGAAPSLKNRYGVYGELRFGNDLRGERGSLTVGYQHLQGKKFFDGVDQGIAYINAKAVLGRNIALTGSLQTNDLTTAGDYSNTTARLGVQWRPGYRVRR